MIMNYRMSQVVHEDVHNGGRCNGTSTKSGIRCKKKAPNGYCKQHMNQKGEPFSIVSSDRIAYLYPKNGSASGFRVGEQEVTTANSRNQPEILMPLDFTNSKELYTIAMVDPDASIAKANGNEFLHWLLINIPAGEDDPGTVANCCVVNYEPPSPPPGSCVHRYFFYLFLQPHMSGSNTITLTALPDRTHFNLQKFVNKYGLQLVDKTYFTISS